MVVFPPCKINLGLHVTHKRPDGYHELETCFFPVPWTDILEIVSSDAFAFTTSGNNIPGEQNSNLCVKAYNLLKKDFKLPSVVIHLHKIIPTGAGLGGGSSDAAFTLRLLNALFQLDLPEQKLMDYASILGSDCAFFVQDRPMLGRGRGEILSDVEVSLAGKFLVLVKPDIHVSTAEAYAGIHPRTADYPIVESLQLPLTSWRSRIRNDFEGSVFKKFPAIAAIKEKLYASGARYASMSGSGSTVFGIFESAVDLSNDFQGATIWSGKIVS